ncbi:MAG TPA: four helix bundle protein [Candidatus Sulfotelmatobacter sp.]|nr:four helix bundle protein [Candidatus Sulfotelmatobacter sp.]
MVTLFDHEKLDVYRLLLKFIAWVTALLEEIPRNEAGKISEVRGQLDRASLSSLLNTAEGNGKRQRQVRAKFFDDARGSAMECAACLDALVAKGVTTEDRVLDGKAMLLRIVSMLSRLVERFDSPGALHEESDGTENGGSEIHETVSYRSIRGRGRGRGRLRNKH